MQRPPESFRLSLCELVRAHRSAELGPCIRQAPVDRKEHVVGDRQDRDRNDPAIFTTRLREVVYRHDMKDDVVVARVEMVPVCDPVAGPCVDLDITGPQPSPDLQHGIREVWSETVAPCPVMDDMNGIASRRRESAREAGVPRRAHRHLTRSRRYLGARNQSWVGGILHNVPSGHLTIFGFRVESIISEHGF